jgi:DNA-binding transcriptional ArsR family regulator
MPRDASSDKLKVMQRNACDAADLLKVLANAKRLLILCQLVQGERSVGDLCGLVGLSQSALSQHLAKLREQGVLASDKRGQMVFYRIANPKAEALLSTLYLMYCKA